MKISKKVLALVLSLLMVVAAVPVSSLAEAGLERAVSSMPFVTLSDTHFFPESLMGKDAEGNDNAAWADYRKNTTKLFAQSEAIVRTALDTIAERAAETGVKYILVPGDLTKDSEYQAHADLAAIFEEYEEAYGLEFLVINGNHDINTTNASTFVNGKNEQGRAITAAEFPVVYKNLGYDLAVERYAYPENGEEKLNALSYVADLDDNFRVIVIDSNNYSFDEPLKQQTNGTLSEDLMKWVKKWADKSKEEGKAAFVMIHHGLAAHMECEPSISFAFPLDNYMDVAETFASWGIHYAFTGHLHTEDIACVVNDDGQVLYDYETPSVTSYPNTYRENTITLKANGKTAMATTTVDFDEEAQLSFEGTTYDNSSFKIEAFNSCFGGAISKDGNADTASFLLGIVKSYLGPILEDINEMGGILEYLKTLDLDLEKILHDFLSPYIGDGIKIGGYHIFSEANLMWFIEDLLSQIEDAYVRNPENLYDLLEELITKIVSIQTSTYSCTKFIDTFGFGDASRPGNLGDAILSVLVYWAGGNEDISDDIFMTDTIKQLDSGDTAFRLFDLLVDVLLHDLIEDGILSKIELRVNKFLNDDIIQKSMGAGANYFLYHVLRGDFSYMNIVDIVFATGILPWSSIYDTLDKLLISKYLTDSQLESIGIFAAYILADFCTDVNPIEKGDKEITYTSDTVEVEATQKNYRLPTMVSATMGEDSETEATINWFSKSTLEATDIEIYKTDKEPEFTGVPTETIDFTIETSSKVVERQFPGIDIGIAGFLWYKFDMVQHTVNLSKLDSGTTYYYRVGNAEYGWWSETGKITTADGSDNVTFLHMTDPQSQNVRQYERAWADVLEVAFDAYPDASFVLSTGDLVDHGDNNKLWQYMFDCGADSLMNTYLMPVTGNHEGFGTNATANYFVLPGVPEQDTSTGVYYSFDYNNVHIAVLNTEALNEDESLSDEQVEWLRKDMEKSDADWKFVALHKAIYSHGSHYKDDDVVAMREQLSALMHELGIDLVFQGHDHVYMRTGSLVSNANTAYDTAYLNHSGKVYKTQVQPTGTTYVISGTCGVKTYIQNDVSLTDKYFPRGEKILSVDAPMFSAVKIRDGVLYFDAYCVTDSGAQEVDSFAIQKDKTQGDVAEGYIPPAEEGSNEDSFITTLKKVFEVFEKILTVVMNIARWYIF